MDTPGYSIWIIVLLVALMFVFFWGALYFVLAFGTWFIARSRLPDEEPRRRTDDDWPLPPDR
jgi:hypothetical protein